MAADEQNNTSIIPAEVSETYEDVYITPKLTKDAGAKNIWKTMRSIDLVTLALDTKGLYETLNKKNKTHELLKVKFTFEGTDPKDDMLTIKYYPRPEDEATYGKNPVIALPMYRAALYAVINK